MSGEDQDDSQKTEDPTQKRLDDALKKGQVPNSREVTSFLMLLVFAFVILWLMPSMLKNTSFNLIRYIEAPHLIQLDNKSTIVLATGLLSDMLIVMLIPISILILVIFLSGFIQHPLVISYESPKPQLSRISLISGFKKIFSMRNIVEFIKGIFKITVVGVICYIVIKSELHRLEDLTAQGVIAILLLLAKIATKIMIGVCSFMAFVAVVDFLYQKFEHIKSLRMSKQDIKDEFKQTDGNPEIKAKLREIRNKRASKRMMAAVPTADVVITNPTHYAVALKYDQEVSEAPIVVAKGQDLIALKIREIAEENKIPIIENPPLARALFSSVELEREIPFEHYNAVAEIIRYVYKLKGKIK